MNVPLRLRFLSCLSRLLCCLVFSLAALVCLASCPGVGTPANSDSNPYGTPSGGGSSGTGSGGSGSSAGGTAGTVSGGNSGGTISGTSSGTGGRMFSPGNLLDAANAGDVNQLLNLIGTANASGDIFSSETEAVEFDAADLGVPAGGSVTLTITGGDRVYSEDAEVDEDGSVSFQVPQIAVNTTITVEMIVRKAGGSTVRSGSKTLQVSEEGCNFNFTLHTAPLRMKSGDDINALILSWSSATSFVISAAPPPDGTTTTLSESDSSVDVYVWLSGLTISYYAEGYTDAGKRIPLNTNVSSMFQNCSSLQIIDLTGFDTSAVTDMSFMFSGCSALTAIPGLDALDTGKVTDMSNMFYTCENLIELNLTSFATGRVTNMTSMFNECWNLVTIYASPAFVTGNVVSSVEMFYDCLSLVGTGGGISNTTIDDAHIDKSYARINGAGGQPGYFTAAP